MKKNNSKKSLFKLLAQLFLFRGAAKKEEEKKSQWVDCNNEEEYDVRRSNN